MADLRRKRRVVLAGDQLDVVPLILEFLENRVRNRRSHPRHILEVGEKREQAAVDLGERSALFLEVCVDQGLRHSYLMRIARLGM